MAGAAAELQEISPDRIRSNPENPRLIFRESEMNELLESIKAVGVKVPVSLYQDGRRFVLIDGERRWRCAKRLNLKTIPAIVQPKPTRLENLLMMFNIHNVRVAWDPMPMALKLDEVRKLLEKEGQATNAKALSGVTGVPLATVRRALELLELPPKYQRMLLEEAKKSKDQQRVTADLFIEVNKSLRAVERHVPRVLEIVPRSRYVDSMVQKYIDGVVDNVVSYREVSKIARAELAGASGGEAIPAIVKLIEDKKYTIDEAYRETVQAAYERRDLLTKLKSSLSVLATVRSKEDLSEEILEALEALRSHIDRLLGR
jgi:ParB family chromosome partitioning protein